jgi:FkbM family methyltransferase
VFSVRHFQRLRNQAKKYGLAKTDAMRLLWSYYGSRRPAWFPQGATEVSLHVPFTPGPDLQLHLRTNGADHLLLEEILWERVYNYSGGPVGTILDLGSNIGVTACYFSRMYPSAEICCVEPDPANVKVLKKNLASNHVRGRVVEGAVGPADGTATLQLHADPRQNSLTAEQGQQQSTQPGTFTVKLWSVPSLLEQLHWPRVDLLKVDIEGAEKALFANSPKWLNQVQAILGEGHRGAGYLLDEIRADLEPAGFQVRVVAETSGAVNFLATR